MPKELTRDLLNTILQSQNIETLSYNEITQFFLDETEIGRFAPDGVCQIDPRTGDRIIFNSARARRPHDNRPEDQSHSSQSTSKDCVICQGRTTKIIDVTDLSEGFTFINKNLFPIFYPNDNWTESQVDGGNPIHNSDGLSATGMHFSVKTLTRKIV